MEKIDTIRVLSMWEPWATLVVYGKKQIETRPKPTSWRGIYLIQATLWNKNSASACVLLRDHLLDVHGFNPGKIIGAVDITDCIEMTGDFLSKVSDAELELGNYSLGRFAWIFENPRRFRAPIDHKGTQGYYGRYKGDTKLLGSNNTY